MSDPPKNHQAFSVADEARNGDDSTNQPLYIVGIGASAGGLAALEQFFQNIPADSGLAFVVVQHLSPDFKSLMDELLAKQTQMTIHQVVEDITVEPNAIYLAPPRKNLTLKDNRLLLSDPDPSNRLFLPIDYFFRSLAEHSGRRAIAVILSGAGSDGSNGINHISRAGGLVIAQEPASASFEAMSLNAQATGLVDLVLLPQNMPQHILSYMYGSTGERLKAFFPAVQPTADNAKSLIFEILHHYFNLDFTLYKEGTIDRCLARRVNAARQPSLVAYAQQLQDDPQEVEALYRDFLVNVTTFFRDAQAFAALRTKVIAPLVRESHPPHPLRIWVAGCATGEEAYTMAMLVLEECRVQQKQVPFRIFATDAHQQSLAVAQTGTYAAEQVENIPAPLLDAYFERVDGGYRVREQVRKPITFLQHNLIEDPAFINLDLVSCRNLLIYLKSKTQIEVLIRLHFGLKKNRFLLLGPSERLRELDNEFEIVDIEWQIYRKLRNVLLLDAKTAISLPNRRPPELGYSFINRHQETLEDWPHEFVRNYLPPSLLVDSNNQVHETIGRGEAYTQFQGGRLTLDLFRLLHKDLEPAVRANLYQARVKNEGISSDVHLTGNDGEPQWLKLTITPVFSQKQQKQFYLISFEPILLDSISPSGAQSGGTGDHQETVAQIASLERELQQTREHLQTTIEELESANTSLLAANEELLGSNEELQSVNEELYSVNTAHQRKIEELIQLSNDMQNLQESSRIGTVFLDSKLNIRYFSPVIAETFNLLPHDIGRPLRHLLSNFNVPPNDLQDFAEAALFGKFTETEIQLSPQEYCLLRVLPYYEENGSTAGVVLTFINITLLKLTEIAAHKNAIVLNNLTALTSNPILSFGEKTQQLLKLGATYLDLQVGLVAKLAGDHYVVTHTTTAVKALKKGTEVIFPEAGTEQIHYKTEGAASLFRVNQVTPPEVIKPFQPESYIAAPIYVDHQLFGLLSFLSRGPHPAPFTETEKSVVQLMAQWLGYELGREEAQEQLQRRTAELARSNANLEQFAYATSHDLQEPLRKISGYLDLLAKRYQQQLDAQGIKFIRQASDGSTQMRAMINGLLQYTRVTSQAKAFEAIDLQFCLNQALANLENEIRQNEAQISYATLPTLAVDANQISRLLTHLIDNALKFRAEIAPRLQLTATPHAQKGWLFSLKDNGIGIAPEDHDKVFQMFWRTHRYDGKNSGQGVGLTVCKRIVERHGGQIWVESRPDQGSTFYFTLM